jgi:hypothetical protein
MEASASTAGRALLALRSSFAGVGAFGGLIPAESLIDGLADGIAPHTAPDFTCTMYGGALTTTYQGVEGLRTGWSDFLSAFETLQIVPGEIRDSADRTAAVEFVHLRGKPRGANGEIEQDAAAVWHFGPEGLFAVEFHLDRERALRSAGLDPRAPGPPVA